MKSTRSPKSKPRSSNICFSATGTITAAGKRSHLFVVPAEGGVAKDLTPGDHDVPPFSLGGQDAYAISPDGKEVAFTSNWDEVGATSTNNDIFVVPITGGEPKKLSTSPGQRLHAALFARR